MKIVVIGSTGHIGTYLIPKLIEDGHKIIAISRQQRSPYQSHKSWQEVKQIKCDRALLEKEKSFGKFVMQFSPDIIIDLICFEESSAEEIVAEAQGRISQYIFCGTIWVYGNAAERPTSELSRRNPLKDYGIKKAAIEKFLLSQFSQISFPATIHHPGHITGSGWNPINPQGNLNAEVFSKLKSGESITLPNEGKTTLHHIHAADLAESFRLSIQNRSNALGESFNIVSENAISMNDYACAVAEWFGKKANITYQPFEAWKENVSAEDARITLDHIQHSPQMSIEKARRILGYNPGYTSLEAIRDALFNAEMTK